MTIHLMTTSIFKPSKRQQPSRLSGELRSRSFWFTRCIGIAITVAVISGCTTIPADLGRGSVDALVVARGQSVDEATEELLESLISQPLNRQSVIRIALINNPEMQATYATLGFGAADIYAAGRIRNPIFSAAILDSSASGERDLITLGLATSFSDLITLPARKRLSEQAFAALRESVAAEVLMLAGKAETAFYYYVGAQQVAALRAQIAKAGGLSASLAQRYADAGNLAPRALALEKAAASEAQLQSLEAQGKVFAARTNLATLLGLSSSGLWQAPAQLKLPLSHEDDLGALLLLAAESRLDLAAVLTQTDLLADRLGVVNWTRWLGDLDIGVERERETDGVRLFGPTLEWEVPIFNQGQDDLLRANAELQIAIAEVRRVATAVDNEVRLASADVAIAKARVNEYRDVLIPQRMETVARAQEEVNYMLIGIFELISLKQDEYDSYQGYLEAIRDYWIARAELSLATGTVLPSNAYIGDQHIDVRELVKPKSGGMDHSGHTNKPAEEENEDPHEGHNMMLDGESP